MLTLCNFRGVIFVLSFGLLRQLQRRADGWALRVLNPAFAERREIVLADLSSVHGVVIQKAVPGRRSASKFYI